jgi:hypothetical protein
MAKNKTESNVDRLFEKPPNTGTEKKPRAKRRTKQVRRRKVVLLPQVVSLGGKYYLVSGSHVKQL